MGQADGNHWGEAVTLLQTTSSTPFFFNFHQGDLGNFSVIGPSGSGKTVVMNFLAAQAQKFAPRTILFDKDRGAEVFVRGIGGTYSRIAAGPSDRVQPAGAARQRGQPRLPARLAGRAARRRAPGRRNWRRSRGAVDAAYANDPALRRLSTSANCWPAAAARSRAIWPAGSMPGSARAATWLAVRQRCEDRLDLSARRSAST
jgi:type IV secretion system protein VirB4